MAERVEAPWARMEAAMAERSACSRERDDEEDRLIERFTRRETPSTRARRIRWKTVDAATAAAWQRAFQPGLFESPAVEGTEIRRPTMAKAVKAAAGEAGKAVQLTGGAGKIAKMRSWLPLFDKRIKEAEARITRTQARKAMVLDQIRKLEAAAKEKGGGKPAGKPAKATNPSEPQQAAAAGWAGDV